MQRGRLRLQLAVAGSVLLHALFVVALYPRPKASLAEPDAAISVQIVRRPPPRLLAQVTGREPAKASRGGPVHPDPLEPREVEAATVAPAVPDADGVRRALRQRVMCADLSDLTEAERRACEAREATARHAEAAGAPKIDLSRAGAFGSDGQPYLARKPVNGCKVMAGGRAAPSGQEGAVAGVGCALSF